MLTGEWMKETDAASKEGRYLAIAGSPKYDLYEADFGWGRLEKWDFLSRGTGLLMSLIHPRAQLIPVARFHFVEVSG